MFERDPLYRAAQKYLVTKEHFSSCGCTSNDDDSNEQSGGAIFSTVMSILYFVNLGIYTYASYLLLTCGANVIKPWMGVLILVAFYLLPLVAPLAFIAFVYLNQLC